MRLLFTAHSYAPDRTGVAEVVRQIAGRLSRRGHQVSVATSVLAGVPLADNIDGVQVRRFRVSGNGALGMRGEVDRYRTFVLSGDWDVVSMHCAQSWTTDALLDSLGVLSAAKVFVGHGFSSLDDPRYQRYFVRLAEALRSVDRVVALSPRLEETRFCAQADLDAPEIIPNGADPGEWRGATLGLRRRWGIGETPWVIAVGNHSPVKGHDRFFSIVPRLQSRGQAIIGTIVGDPYPAAMLPGRVGVKGGCWYTCRLRARLTGVVQLRSGLSRAEVVSAVREADLLLVTSRREASPVVLFESMAAGTPWVSTDVGAVRDSEGGIVVSSDDAMESAIMDLLAEPSRRARLGEAGRRQVVERTKWDAIAARHETLYARLVEAGGDPARADRRLASGPATASRSQ